MPEPGQQAIVDYFMEQARWRREKAAEYPEDDRNLRSAEGLEELAVYVLNLDPSDQRVIELTTLGVRDGVFAPFAGDSSAHAVGRFRYHREGEDCGAFLTALVGLMRDDAVRFAREHGELPG